MTLFNACNIYIMDLEFNTIGIIDDFISFIWTDRYRGYGDFELQLTESQYKSNKYKMNYYITMNQSNHAMIIEKIEITNSYEDGSTYLISGRSLESMLTRRVIKDEYESKQNVWTDIKNLLYANIIEVDGREVGNLDVLSPKNISTSNLKFDDPDLKWLGENLYDVIVDLCSHKDSITSWPSTWKGKWPKTSTSPAVFDLGFQIVFDNPENVDFFYFRIYDGVDRTYEQAKVKVVEFSRWFNNLGDYEYSHDRTEYKNAAIVRANFQKRHKIPQEDEKGNVVKDSNGNIKYETKKDDEGNVLKDSAGNIQYKYEYEDYYIYTSCKTTTRADFDTNTWTANLGRREIFVDSNLERRKRDKDGELTDNLWTREEFVAKMKKEGFQNLYDLQETKQYTAELYDHGQYVYDVDYNLGDLVKVVTESEGVITARITEVICSWDMEGFRIFPIFDFVDDD